MSFFCHSSLLGSESCSVRLISSIFFFFFVLRKKTFFSSYLVDPASVDLVGSDGSTAASKTVRHLAIACDPRERSSVLADVVKVEQFESRVRLRCDALIHRCTVPTQR